MQYASGLAADTAHLAVRLTPPHVRAQVLERVTMPQHQANWAAHRLTIVTAAAGYGKTTFAAQLTAAAGVPSAWLTLDADDDDAVQLVILLAAALARRLPLDPAAVISRARDARDLDAALHSLLQALTAADQPLVVVIDDVHYLQQPIVLQLLERLLLHGPPHVRWLLLSRYRLPLALSRMRLNGDVLELSEDDLRLDQAEISRLLTLQTSVAPDAALTALLAERTEGWIAGIRLAALRLPARIWTDPAALPQLAALLQQNLQTTAGYLLDEVLRDLSPELEAVLLQMAPLPYFTVELCAVVTGRSDSRQLMQQIVDRHLFVQRLDGAVEWYRLHALLRAALSARAALHYHAEQRRSTVRRAADWFAAAGDLYHAVQLLLTVDGAAAAALLAGSARQMLLEHRLYDLERLFGLLPPELLQADPQLSVVQCWLQFLSGDFAAFHASLARLQACCAAVSPQVQAELTALDLLAAYTRMQHGDLCQRASDALMQIAPSEAFARGWINLLAGMTVQLQGDRRSAPEFLAAASAEFQRCAPVFSVVHTVVVQAMLLQYAARYDACLNLCREQLGRLTQVPQRAIALDAQFHLLEFISGVHYLRDETSAAAAAAQQWADLAAQLRSPLMMLLSAVRQQLCTALEQQPAEGLQLVEQVRQWLHSSAVRERPASEHLQLVFDTLRLAVRCGAQDALSGIAAAGRLTLSDLTDEAPYLQRLALAYVLAFSVEATPRFSEILLRQIQIAGRQRLLHLQAWLLVLLALYEHRHGGHNDARLYLRRALVLIERTGSIRMVLDLAALQPVLRKVDTLPARRLLAQLQLPPTASGPLLTIWERRIAALLAEGKSAAAIAADVGVAVSTVRFHLTRIYRKLAVTRRSEAITRLRTLPLHTAEEH